MPKSNLKKQKILYLKETQNPSRYYYNSIITNLKLQHKPKISSCFKNTHIKIDLLLLLLLLFNRKEFTQKSP